MSIEENEWEKLDYFNQPYCKIENGKKVDSDWAFVCGLVGVQPSEGNDAYIFHHYKIDQLASHKNSTSSDLLDAFIQTVRDDYGKSIRKICVGGISLQTIHRARPRRMRSMELELQQRRILIASLQKGLGIGSEHMDIRWGKDNSLSKIRHDSQGGIMRLERNFMT